MLKGKTSTGFEYEIEDGALEDWEVLEALVDIDEGHFGSSVRVLKLLLGEEQAKLLKAHCRDKDSGRVPRNRVFSELSEILQGTGSEDEKAKNA